MYTGRPEQVAPRRSRRIDTIVPRSPDVGSAILFGEFDALLYLRQVPLVPFYDKVDDRLEALADVNVVAVPGGVLSRHFASNSFLFRCLHG